MSALLINAHFKETVTLQENNLKEPLIKGFEPVEGLVIIERMEVDIDLGVDVARVGRREVNYAFMERMHCRVGPA